MQTYGDKLKDPRWQKKRLEIFERDKWTCKRCGDTETSLEIHHLKYVKGLQPWEYANDDLVTLCEPCHEALSPKNKPRIKAQCPRCGADEIVIATDALTCKSCLYSESRIDFAVSPDWKAHYERPELVYDR